MLAVIVLKTMTNYIWLNLAKVMLLWRDWTLPVFIAIKCYIYI